MTASILIAMGSDSDWEVMQEAATILDHLEIPYTVDVLSAHRTPERMADAARTAHERGIHVIIAGAGGAAHLPGMIASYSPLPVIGVPIRSHNSIDGWDSILSILQMPGGVPVATVALNGAKNAGLLAAQIAGIQDPAIREQIISYKNDLKDSVIAKAAALRSRLNQED